MNDELIIALVEKFGAGDIAELDYHDERTHLVLRKESALGRNTVQVSEILKIEDTTTTPSFSVKQDIPEQSQKIEIPKGELITSPFVSTFYSAPTPDSPPFVSIGTKVKAGETLCILEAMKMMNKLLAEFDCEILNIFAKKGDLVEFGQTLFEVKRL